jgi:PAS domain-containing protein
MIKIMSTDIVYAIVAGLVLQTILQYLYTRFQQRQEVQQLRKQVERLQNKVTLLESSHQDAPIPIWLKDKHGVMLALNPEYERTFLIPHGKTREDYLHKTDYDVWPEDIAAEYIRNDRLVMRTRKTWKGTETILDHQGNKSQWQIIKYPRKAGGVLIGIAGMAIPPI